MSDHMPYDVLREAAGWSTEPAMLLDAIDALEQAESNAADLPKLLADAWAIGWMSGAADHAEGKCRGGLGTPNPYLNHAQPEGDHHE